MNKLFHRLSTRILLGILLAAAISAVVYTAANGALKAFFQYYAMQPEVFTPAHCSWGSADSRAFFIFSLRTARREAPKRMPLCSATVPWQRPWKRRAKSWRQRSKR